MKGTLKNKRDIFLKATIILVCGVGYWALLDFIRESQRSPEEIRYANFIKNEVAGLHNGKEVCDRVTRANNIIENCEVISEDRKNLDMDSCKTIYSTAFCETTMTLVYNLYQKQVDDYKNSIISKTYKLFTGKERIRLTSEYAWADRIEMVNLKEMQRLDKLSVNSKQQ
ncbi:hypothetical protein SOX05_08865 [Pseudomonas putida]|nr:hypothetical protein [Pseudomonas putida]MDY4319373.1 hypothetical protein [Pseudomonas putida]MDY4352758.1 hypothetical protein [Pseudomonas putida]